MLRRAARGALVGVGAALVVGGAFVAGQSLTQAVEERRRKKHLLVDGDRGADLDTQNGDRDAGDVVIEVTGGNRGRLSLAEAVVVLPRAELETKDTLLQEAFLELHGLRRALQEQSRLLMLHGRMTEDRVRETVQLQQELATAQDALCLSEQEKEPLVKTRGRAISEICALKTTLSSQNNIMLSQQGVMFTQAEEIQGLHGQLAAKAEEARRKDEDLEARDKAHQEETERIMEQGNKLFSEMEGRINAGQARIRELQGECASLRSEVRDQKTSIEELSHALAAKEVEALVRQVDHASMVREKDATIERQESTISTLNKSITDLKTTVADHEAARRAMDQEGKKQRRESVKSEIRMARHLFELRQQIQKLENRLLATTHQQELDLMQSEDYAARLLIEAQKAAAIATQERDERKAAKDTNNSLNQRVNAAEDSCEKLVGIVEEKVPGSMKRHPKIAQAATAYIREPTLPGDAAAGGNEPSTADSAQSQQQSQQDASNADGVNSAPPASDPSSSSSTDTVANSAGNSPVQATDNGIDSASDALNAMWSSTSPPQSPSRQVSSSSRMHVTTPPQQARRTPSPSPQQQQLATKEQLQLATKEQQQQQPQPLINEQQPSQTQEQPQPQSQQQQPSPIQQQQQHPQRSSLRKAAFEFTPRSQLLQQQQQQQQHHSSLRTTAASFTPQQKPRSQPQPPQQQLQPSSKQQQQQQSSPQKKLQQPQQQQQLQPSIKQQQQPQVPSQRRSVSPSTQPQPQQQQQSWPRPLPQQWSRQSKGAREVRHSPVQGPCPPPRDGANEAYPRGPLSGPFMQQQQQQQPPNFYPQPQQPQPPLHMGAVGPYGYNINNSPGPPMFAPGVNGGGHVLPPPYGASPAYAMGGPGFVPPVFHAQPHQQQQQYPPAGGFNNGGVAGHGGVAGAPDQQHQYQQPPQQQRPPHPTA